MWGKKQNISFQTTDGIVKWIVLWGFVIQPSPFWKIKHVFKYQVCNCGLLSDRWAPGWLDEENVLERLLETSTATTTTTTTWKQMHTDYLQSVLHSDDSEYCGYVGSRAILCVPGVSSVLE